MARKHKTIDNNPLTAYLNETSRNKAQTKKSTSKDVEPIQQKKRKIRVTIHLSVELIDKVKNAVYLEPGLTLTEFAERALTHELKKWEKEWGEAYPQRKDYQLKGGRPLK